MNNTYEQLGQNIRLNFEGTTEELTGEINRLFNCGVIDDIKKADDLQREAESYGKFSFIPSFVNFISGIDTLFFARMSEAEYRKISHKKKHGCGSEMDRALRARSLRWFRRNFKRQKTQKNDNTGYENTFSFSLPTVSAE